jgi:pentatricopeptide repeat protein
MLVLLLMMPPTLPDDPLGRYWTSTSVCQLRLVMLIDRIWLTVQNIAAEVRTYNTIIGACARAGQPEAAASVYERMLQDHAVPTATTATALVSAFAKSDQACGIQHPTLDQHSTA